MRKEKCCGCIVLKDEKVLLVQELEGHWGLPKGHVEENESEIETAKREVKEETNLDVEIDASKKYEISYIIRDEIDKTVFFFPAKVVGGNLQRQESEISDVRWVPLKEAALLVTHDNLKKMLVDALKDLGYII